MARCSVASSSTLISERFSLKCTSILPSGRHGISPPWRLGSNSKPPRCETTISSCSCGVSCSTNAVLSEVPPRYQYFRVGAESTGSIPSDHLLHVIETAARTGAQVIMDAVNKPRTYKGLTHLETDKPIEPICSTDKTSKAAVLDVVRNNFQDHLIIGEEGGLIGDPSSDYLWCIDTLVPQQQLLPVNKGFLTAANRDSGGHEVVVKPAKKEVNLLKFLVLPIVTAVLVLSTICYPPASIAQTVDIQKGATLFTRSCIGCHDAGGNIVQPGATLFSRDLTRNGVDTEEEIYRLTYYGKGKMPGFGEKCSPRGQCTFGPRLGEDEIKLLAQFVKLQAEQGWTNIEVPGE